MNKKLIIFLSLLAITSVFSQKNTEVIVTGTVYISSSISPGVMNGKVISEGPHAFRKQPIYFKMDSTTVKATTDSVGVFSVKLKEGKYVVYQEEGLGTSKKSLSQFGSDGIEVKKDGGPYKISFHNSSNRRSTMNSGNGLPGSNSKKKNQNVSEKK